MKRVETPNRVSDVTYDWVVKNFDLDRERIIKQKRYKRRFSLKRFNGKAVPEKKDEKFYETVVSQVGTLLPKTKAGHPYDRLEYTVHFSVDPVIVEVVELVIESDFQVKRRIMDEQKEQVRRKLGYV